MASDPLISTGRVLDSFGGAADRYNSAAGLQQSMAWRLAGNCSRLPIEKGLWVDLGSGTGCLADALEQTFPGQMILRLDGSIAMLHRQRPGTRTLLHDLSRGLPSWPERPQLLASSFALHWLPDPALKLRQWLEALSFGGWLAVTLPVQGSFPEWQRAADQAGERCSALSLPERTELLSAIPSAAIQLDHCLNITQTAAHPKDLLKPMLTTGACVTQGGGLSTAGWRKLFRAWPVDPETGDAMLSWRILFVILKR